MSKYVFLFFYINICFASGNYQQKSYPTKNSSFSSTIPRPETREVLSVEKDILSWNRASVSVNSVEKTGEKIRVKGSYSKKSDFQRFLSKLKGEDSGIKREVMVKESSTSFAGLTTYRFEAEVENAW